MGNRLKQWILDDEVEQRLLLIALVVAIPYFISSISYDILYGESKIFLAIDVSFLVICISFIFLSRNKKFRSLLIAIFSLLITAGITFFWQISGGISGGAAYVFIVVSVLLILMNRGVQLIIYTLLMVALVFVLTSNLFEISGDNDYGGLLFDFILNLIVLALLLMIFKLALDKERNTLEEQNVKMSELNKELSIKSAELQDYNSEIKLIQENLERLVDQRAAKLEEENERDLEYSFINAHLVRAPIANMLAVTQLLENDDQQMKELTVHILKLDATVREIGKVLAENRV